MSSPGFERELALYISNGKISLAKSGEMVYSIATDKGTVCGLPLQFSLLACPTNEAILCCPQVAKPRAKGKPEG